MTGNEFRQFHDSSVLEFENENGRHGGPAMVHTLAANVAQQQEIQQAVAHLLNSTCCRYERRWEPRVLYVQPVSISFRHSRPLTEEEPSLSEFRETDTEIPAVTTDISTAGVGLLTCYRIPTSRVVVRFPEVSFDCAVRWSRKLGHPILRYGLNFVKLLDKPSREG